MVWTQKFVLIFASVGLCRKIERTND